MYDNNENEQNSLQNNQVEDAAGGQDLSGQELGNQDFNGQSFNAQSEQSGGQGYSGQSFYTQSEQDYSQSYGSQSYGNQNYSYNTQAENKEDTYKWQPDSDKYNTYQDVTKTEKKRRRWWIPVTIVLAVMVVIIAVGAVIGFRAFRNWIRDNASSNGSGAVIESVQPETIATPSSTPIESSAGSSTGSFFITDVSDVVDEIMPAVVSITSRSLVSTGDYWSYFFGGGFGNNSGSTEEVPSGLGSGTIIGQNDTELLILTSYHVVEDSSSLYVTFNDDASVDGYIKSASEENDIAIVAVPLADISDDTIKAIKIASLCSDEPDVGDGCIVIGNALGYGQSVTTGIVSAKEREITVEGKTLTVLQTNAAINSGNSGGCMLNAAGQVIGISEAKVNVNMNSAGVEGMCYAIPIYTYRELIEDLMVQESKVPEKDENDSFGTNTNGAYLGIYGRDIDTELAESYGLPEGVYVIGVTSGGGAQKAGMQEGDIIVAVDGEDASTMDQLQAILAEHSPGDTVVVSIMREGRNGFEEQTVEVTLTGSL